MYLASIFREQYIERTSFHLLKDYVAKVEKFWPAIQKAPVRKKMRVCPDLPQAQDILA
jgi:hypothetical protein